MRIVKAAALLLTLVSSEALADITLVGSGAGAQCSAWNEGRKSKVYVQLSEWGLGFVSGAASFGGVGDPLKNTNHQAFDAWIDTYCQANPAEYFSDAVTAFVKEHRTR